MIPLDQPKLTVDEKTPPPESTKNFRTGSKKVDGLVESARSDIRETKIPLEVVFEICRPSDKKLEMEEAAREGFYADPVLTSLSWYCEY